MATKAQEALRYYRAVQEEVFGKKVTLEPETNLERRIHSYAGSVHQIFSDGFEGYGYPTEKDVEFGQKLLEEVERSNLPEDRKTFARKQATATMEWYRATLHLLSHTYETKI